MGMNGGVGIDGFGGGGGGTTCASEINNSQAGRGSSGGGNGGYGANVARGGRGSQGGAGNSGSIITSSQQGIYTGMNGGVGIDGFGGIWRSIKTISYFLCEISFSTATFPL